MKKTKKVVLYLLLAIISIMLIFTIYEIATVNNQYYFGEKTLQIPIFTYHNIVKEESEIKDDCMQTTLETFENQITGLMKLGYKPISYQDLVNYSKGEKQISKWSFLITFDDGYENVYKYAYPIAKKYNIPMTIFVIDNCVGNPGYFSWKEAKEMDDTELIDIYSHGLSHIKYNEIDKEELAIQTNKAYANLQKKLDNTKILKVFAYPYGLYSEDGNEKLAKEGYIQNLMDNKINSSKTLNLNKLHRCYPCNDSIFKTILKQQYRFIKYRD